MNAVPSFSDDPSFADGPRFADGKADDAFRTIGEVATALALRPHVLRYWEEQFPMLRPVKRSGGRRYYRPEDIELVRAIDRLVHREGYTLKGARKFLESPEQKPAPEAAAEPAVVPAAELRPDLLKRLRGIRAALARALDEE